jgi:hypothetical protein
LLGNRARGRCRSAWVGHRPKTEEELKQLSELSSAKEKVVFRLGALGEVVADPKDDDDVEEDDGKVNQLEAEELHLGISWVEC